MRSTIVALLLFTLSVFAQFGVPGERIRSDQIQWIYGPTAQRHTNPPVGFFYYNTDSSFYQYYNGITWVNMIGSTNFTNNINEIIKDSLDNITASDGIVYSGRNFSADTTFLSTQTYTDSADAARFTLLDNKYKVTLKNLTWELNASSHVWNREVERNQVVCNDAGLDTVYFDLPTVYLLRPDTLSIDSVWIFMGGDGASTIDKFQILASVVGNDSVVYTKNYANVVSTSYTFKNIPEATWIINYPIQFAMYIDVDTEVKFYSIRIYYTWFKFRELDETNPPPPEE